jgi:hypothetical protein
MVLSELHKHEHQLRLPIRHGLSSARYAGAFVNLQIILINYGRMALRNHCMIVMTTMRADRAGLSRTALHVRPHQQTKQFLHHFSDDSFVEVILNDSYELTLSDIGAGDLEYLKTPANIFSCHVWGVCFSPCCGLSNRPQ